jgi:ubiquinone/menaquinone biosynthesis C-methylase UbiE
MPDGNKDFVLKVDENTKENQLYENADYEIFWTGIQQQKLDELEQVLVAKMLHLPARRMMDIGCGYGRLWERYQAQCDEIVLLDSSKSLLKQAYHRSGGRAICLACDLHAIPFRDGAFDQVMMVRVLHHLPDTHAAMAELSRLITPGGHLLFSYCNKKNAERVLRWLVGKNSYHPYKLEPAWVWERFFMHHPHYIHQNLEDVGLQVKREMGAGVLDKIAGILGKAGKNFPLGVTLAPLFASQAVAPWIFVDALKSGERMDVSMLPLEQLMRCPQCHGDLEKDAGGMHCITCKTHYPMTDGVYHFI